MKFRTSIPLSILILLPAVAPGQWTPAVQVFPGPSIETHATFRRTPHPAWIAESREQMAFTQVTGSGSRICIAHTFNFAAGWSDSVEDLTGDSSWNDFASFAATSYNRHDSTAMILWQRNGDQGSVWYRYCPDTAWRAAAPLTGITARESCPYLAPTDSGYLAVWESDGRIAYTGFLQGAWSSPEFITSAGDTSNHNPQVCSISWWYGRSIPLVIWERPARGQDTWAVVYSFRTPSGWSAVDTIGWTGDNRRPRFSLPNAPYVGMLEVTYESNRSGTWEIYAAHAWSMDSLSLIWTDRDVLVSESSMPGADNRDASFFFWPMITSQSSQAAVYPDLAGVWVAGSGTNDSIALSSFSSFLGQYQTIAPGSTNRNPRLSCGHWLGGYVRVFATWENNATGNWKLYESHIDLEMGAVKEQPRLPADTELRQNYPNPFNSVTRFDFRISNKELVRLKVFDVLGREVATLVNEEKGPGSYTVTWDATGRASGVYLCQMKAGKFVAARKVLLVR